MRYELHIKGTDGYWILSGFYARQDRASEDARRLVSAGPPATGALTGEAPRAARVYDTKNGATVVEWGRVDR